MRQAEEEKSQFQNHLFGRCEEELGEFVSIQIEKGTSISTDNRIPVRSSSVRASLKDRPLISIGTNVVLLNALRYQMQNYTTAG